MFCIYKKQIVKIICPENLLFPDKCIRNVLIELKNKEMIIAHISKLKKVKYVPINNFL